MRPSARTRGFTLVEVLIALAIIAVGLGAAVRATIHVTSGAEQMKIRTLALWVAEDRLAESLARSSISTSGASQGTVTQAGLGFVWRESVAPTAHPALRSIAIEVAPTAQPDYVVARLTGMLAMPAPTQSAPGTP